MLLVALVLAQVLDVTVARPSAGAPQFPFTDNGPGLDLGCAGMALQESSFPGHVVDAVHHETILYNVSRCTGGFIKATSNAGGRGWDVDIGPDGELKGRDRAGHAWRYDAAARRYVVAATGASCARPDFRAMCAAAAPD